MGRRPLDFDEDLVRKAPTFRKWLQLKDGEKLRYACRDFCKGSQDGEERLMRRIMIARRNNIKDHELLKRARKSEAEKKFEINSNIFFYETTTLIQDSSRDKNEKTSFDATRIIPNKVPNDKAKLVNDDMDVKAIENTRSYKKWMQLKDGQQLRYNQIYYKGKSGQDNLLRRNIWRRMKYRRESKRLIAKMNEGSRSESLHHPLSQQEITALKGTTSGIKLDQGNTNPDSRFLSQFRNISRHADMEISENFNRTHLGTRGGNQKITHHNPYHPLSQNSLMISASTKPMNTRVENSFRNFSSFLSPKLPIRETIKKHQLHHSNSNYNYRNNTVDLSSSAGLKTFTAKNDGYKNNIINEVGSVGRVFDNRCKIPITLNNIPEESYCGSSAKSIDTQLKNSNIYSIHNSKNSGCSGLQKGQKRDHERLSRNSNISMTPLLNVTDTHNGIGLTSASLSNIYSELQSMSSSSDVDVGRFFQEKKKFFSHVGRNLKRSVSTILDDDALIEWNLRRVVDEALGPVHCS